MKNMIVIGALLGLLLLVLLFLPGPAPSSATAPATAIIDVRLFDGTEFVEDATVVLADGRVLAAGAGVEVPAGATVIDGRGKTALPGLIDAHVHAFGPAQEDALRFGVTTLLDMFRPPMDTAQVRAARESLAATQRADLFSAGYLATVPGGHGTQYGFPVPTPTTAAAETWVAARLAEGSDYIKIVIEDGSSFGGQLPTLAPDTVRALVAAAHAQGVLAVAHVSTYAAARQALEAGVDGLVHLFVDAPVDAPFIAAVQAAGAWVVPTATVLAAAHGHSAAAQIRAHPVLGTHLSPMQAQTLGQTFPGAAARRDRWPMIMAGVRDLHEAGVPLLAGSDAPNPGTAHGASLHHELALLVEAGLSPVAALRAATSTPARVFGLPDRGCLQPGCRADLLLVDGNPLEDIGATARIAGVWKNGHSVALDRAAARPPVAAAATELAAPVDLMTQPTRWMPASDQYQQGQSTAHVAASGAAGGGLVVTGALRAGFAFPYAGAMWNANEVPMQAADLSGHRVLELELEGSAANYRVMFVSGAPGDFEFTVRRATLH